MNIVAVDDEKLALEALMLAIQHVKPKAKVYGFRSPREALEFVQENSCDIAFLDINMRGMSGIELAKKMKLTNTKLNIIFTTGYSEYAGEAFLLHASGYVLKPISEEKIKKEIEDLRHPIGKVKANRQVVVHTFGNFEVYIDGEVAQFQYNKAKEMFAYLIDRNGALCTNKEIMAIIFGDDVKESYFRNIKVDLMKTLPEEIFAKQWGKIGINTQLVKCDYYDWLNGVPSAINDYTGEYMAQYSWSESTLSSIKDISFDE